jgi:hypothetical protein
MASWSGVAPAPRDKSLAEKLSSALGDIPVSGADGFLWIAKDGSTRTSRQAVSVRTVGGQYAIPAGAEVMTSMAAGWHADFEEVFHRERNADGLMRAGAAWDILYLCPDSALRTFEAAAQLSHPVAAYNAAMIRLARRGRGDLKAAVALLTRAANAGDAKALKRLEMIRAERQ